MSIKVTQAWDGVDLSLEQGSGSNSSSYATVYYIVEGTQDDAEACTQAYNTAPEEFAGIPKKSVAISERLTDTAWKIEYTMALNRCLQVAVVMAEMKTMKQP